MMAVVKEVHQRAGGQQQIGQERQRMGQVLTEQVCGSGYREQAERRQAERPSIDL
jgi:hypothetical protein